MGISIFIFLIVTLSLLGAFHFLPRYTQRERTKVRKRLADEFHAKQPTDAPRSLYRDLDVLNLTSVEEYKLLGEVGKTPVSLILYQWRKAMEQQLQEAALSLRVAHLFVLAGACALALGLAGALFMRWPGGILGCIVGAGVPFGFVHFKRKARREKFLKQLPNAFDLMARVIRSGQAVPQAFQAVADAFEEPLAGEFMRYQHQQNLGLPPEIVFQELTKRSSILEFRIFGMAMMIQRQAGGNLSEVLERLAALIRQRLRLRQQVRTLTAEGRLQGLTLVILPFVMFVAMFFVNRPYAEVLLDHVPLLCATGALMGIGLLWVNKIVNVEG